MPGPVADLSLDALAAAIPDGALLALPPDNSLPPNALARALARRGARGLRLLGVPVSGYATDLLIGAGCVAAVESSAVSLGEAGPAPRFRAALRAGRLAHARRHLPGDPHHAAGRREGRAVPAAARAAGQRHPRPPAGLAGDRQPLRATPATRSCCCRHSRPRSPPSTRSPPTKKEISGSAGTANARPSPMPPAAPWSRSSASCPAASSTTSGWPPARSQPPTSRRWRSPSAAPGPPRCSMNTRPMPGTSPPTPPPRAAKPGSPRISKPTCAPPRARAAE